MGFDIATFFTILDCGFREKWDVNPIPRKDVPSTAIPRTNRRSLDAAGALGLALHYLNSTMHEVSLQQIFALIPTTVSRYVNFALEILRDTLRKLRDAAIQWPKDDDFENLNSLVVERHNLLLGAFGTADGLKLPIQVSRDQEIENATYNGWLHEHFVSCVFAFAANGMFHV
jgi:hypothetical protein